MQSAVRLLLILVVVCSVGSCKKKEGANPVGPTNTPTAWTGTLTRPSGLGTITVSWASTSVDEGGVQAFKGPMTLTFNGVSVTVPDAQGIPSGNSSKGYEIHVDFHANQGQIASVPTCSIHAANASASSSDPFPSPYASINAVMDVQFNGCAFIGSSLLVRENQQLSLTK